MRRVDAGRLLRAMESHDNFSCDICGTLLGYGWVEEGSAVFCSNCIYSKGEEARQCLLQPEPPPRKEPEFITVMDFGIMGTPSPPRTIPNPRYKG